VTTLRIFEQIHRGAWKSPIFCVIVSLCFAQGLVGADSNPPPNVLLITVDTLRADHLGCYGDRSIKTPSIDELAHEGVRFESAYSQVPLTLPSHVVILTGTYPMYNHVRDFAGVGLPENIGIVSEAFKRHGYTTAAFVSAFVLDGTLWGLRRGFDLYDDRFDPRQYQSQNPGNIQRRGDETVDRFLDWFARRPAKPFFVWIHLYDPHSPYDPPEPYRSRYRGRPYDGEIAFDDAQVGRVLKELRDAGIFDRTAIAFLSDHGESLGEHGEAEHGFFLYNATIHVPLIIKPAGAKSEKARSVSAVASTVDIAPTILQLAGLDDPITRQFQGRSLAAWVRGEPPAESRNRTAYAETLYPWNNFGWSPLKALITGKYKYIEAPEPELYDLKNDPVEKRNLLAQHRAEANSFKGQLDGIESRYEGGTAVSGTNPLSQETIEKLKSLGYLAYSAPTSAARPGAKLADPKSKIQVYRTVERANDLAEAGRYHEADRLVQQLARTEAKLYLIPFMRGEYASFEGRYKDAQQHFHESLKLNPDFQQAILGLAKAYRADGQADEAKTFLELDVHKYPHDYLGYYGLAVITAEAGSYTEAISYFQICLREKPDYGPAYLGLGIAQVESQKYAEALPNLRRATGLGSQEVLRLNYLGIATDRLGDRQGAIKLYQQALALGPEFIPARLNLAFAYRDAGDMENARREYKIICDSDSSLCQQFRSYFQ
jgi:arylsulfatase A-like enzyme/tetratricopeptide (TPR) repeat protein